MAGRMMNYFSDEMSTIIDAEQKITHEKLAERVEQQLEDSKTWKGFDAGSGVRPYPQLGVT
jgi:nucleosome binding factor SPN SPT16 subunit